MADARAAERFLEQGGSKLTGPVEPKKPARLSSTEKQQERERHWAWIKRSMLAAQEHMNGHVSCMICGAVNPPRLDLHHILPTGRGGKWEPENAILTCRDCHEEVHGIPQWRSRK